MTFGIHPIVSTSNEKGQTHARQQQEQDSFAGTLAHRMHAASRTHPISEEQPRNNHNSDVVQLHTGLDFALRNLSGQIMWVNAELTRTLKK